MTERIKEVLDEWVDLKGLIEVLPGSWSRKYIYYMVRTKQLPHYKPSPRKLLFHLPTIEQWLLDSKIE